MLQPSNRPAGSTQVLRFTGLVSAGPLNGVYPKPNGEVSADVVLGSNVLRCLLGNTADLSSPGTSLPGYDYDDTMPAGDSPHPAVPGTGILNPTDNDISARTWCQNTYVTVTPLDAGTAAALLTTNVSQQKVCLDDAKDSGLGSETGRPVVVIGLVLAGPPQVLNLDILIEIRHSASR